MTLLADSTPASVLAGVESRPVLRSVPWTALHVLTLVVGAVVLIQLNRGQWFYADDWNFVAERGPGLADTDLFRPHNDHWATIPILIYWALGSLVGGTSYLPYMAVAIALHLCLAHVLWRAALRTGASPAVTTCLVGVFIVLGAGAENIVWAFQMGFVGAIAFGWVAVLLHDHDGPFDRRDVAGWAAMITALMFSGPAITMIVVAGATVWLRRRRLLDTGLTVGPPLVVLAVWFAIEGRHANRLPSDSEDRWLLVDFAWTGLTHAAEVIVGVPGSGALVVLALLIWWGRRTNLATGPTSLAFAGLGGAVFFYLLTGVGRVSQGVDTARVERYVYIAAALILPAAAYTLSRLFPNRTGSTLFIAGLCAVVGVHNLADLRLVAHHQRDVELRFKDVVLAGAQIVEDEDPLNTGIFDEHNPDLSAEALRRLAADGWLPDGTPGTEAVLTAKAALDVVLLYPDADLAPAARLSGNAVELVPTDPLGDAPCVIARPLTSDAGLEFRSDNPSWRVRILDRHEGARIPFHLSDGVVDSQVRNLVMPADAADLTADVGELTVVVALSLVGPTTFCGVLVDEAAEG